MIYDVSVAMTFDYGPHAGGGRHLLRLEPRHQDERQIVRSCALEVDPQPIERVERRDFFGNGVCETAFEPVDAAVAYRLRARVECSDDDPSNLDSAPALADLAAELRGERALGPSSPLHFRGASPMVRPDLAVAQFAHDLADPHASVLENARRLNQAIHDAMVYDPDATSVDTPLAAAFAQRRGVCQDFAHIMIAALRGLGIPAGYVSGLMRTLPPPGQPRLEGADAMHAWVRVWCGAAMGWIEFDPTNALVVAGSHIVVAYGRDYSDVAPVKGVVRTAAGQAISQAVDVIAVDEDQPC